MHYLTGMSIIILNSYVVTTAVDLYIYMVIGAFEAQPWTGILLYEYSTT